MFASLLQFSNNPSGKPACLFFILQDSAFRIAILPDLSGHVTTKWYRGKCASLAAAFDAASTCRCLVTERFRVAHLDWR